MLLVDEIAGQEAQMVGPAKTTKLTISVRHLLHMRVELEWRFSNEQVKETLQPKAQVQGNAVERRLNTAAAARSLGLFAASAERNVVKLERMCKTAESAFTDQRIFVLLDDRQAEDLDEMVDVKRTGTATFLLLTPL